MQLKNPERREQHFLENDRCQQSSSNTRQQSKLTSVIVGSSSYYSKRHGFSLLSFEIERILSPTPTAVRHNFEHESPKTYRRVVPMMESGTLMSLITQRSL